MRERERIALLKRRLAQRQSYRSLAKEIGLSHVYVWQIVNQARGSDNVKLERWAEVESARTSTIGQHLS